ncbi:hypothetical protein JCM10908_003713 [Rhodotorula pacifica]|uniref:MIP/aquaporin family protein n=1 Tax=Rhodotorula pacifica TaxID=1495444 RepID=UPI00316DC217
MDGFMNMAKQAYGEYQQSQGQGHNQQQQQGGYSQQGQQGYGGGNTGSGSSPMDMLSSFLNGNQAASHAADESGEDSGLFKQAISHVSQNFDDGEDIDEQGVQAAHEQAYGQGNASNLGAKSMGAAAAMQALKKFTQGGGSVSSGGGNQQSALIGQAMSEAAKLFNQSGGAANGGKQDVVNGAAQMMMKLLIQSKMSGMFGTGGGAAGGSGGGMGQLMSSSSLTAGGGSTTTASGGIGLGVTTTISDTAGLFGGAGTSIGSGGSAMAEKAKAEERDGKPKRPWRRWSWCGALRGKLHRSTKTTISVTQPPAPPLVKSSRRLAIKNHFVACLGEFVGTCLFIFLALGSTSVANLMITSVTGNAAASGRGAAPNTSSLFYISCGAGLSLMVTTFTFARISGAFFNPAVSLGMALTGALKPMRAVLLICVQFLGGMCGAAIVAALTPGSRTFTTTLAPAMSISRGLFLEMMLTSVLVLAILFLVAEKHKRTVLAPVGIGLALFVAELYGVYWTGGSLNPARSLGPAIVSHSFPPYFWIYMVGPSLGAVLAAAFYKLLKWLEYETVIPSSPAPPLYVGVPGGSAYLPEGSITIPMQGSTRPDLLTHEAPTLSTAAALRSVGPTGMRNSQLQERFDRLEEIIEQLGGRDSLELSRVSTQEFGGGGGGDETNRGRWCNPGRVNARGEAMSPSDAASPTSGDEDKHGNSIVMGRESQLIDNLAPLSKLAGAGSDPVAPSVEGRKQQ